jgi:hypothetical protein
VLLMAGRHSLCKGQCTRSIIELGYRIQNHLKSYSCDVSVYSVVKKYNLRFLIVTTTTTIIIIIT